MRVSLMVLAPAFAAALSGCGGESRAAAPLTRGGDDRTGAYEVVPDWLKPAPEHGDDWRWGAISGVAVDTPDRIVVISFGDWNAQGQEVPGRSHFVSIVDGQGNVVENWSQWDTLFHHPHQVYIDPYDPERHVWIVELGGVGFHEQILKFTNDGSRLVMRIRDPEPGITPPEQRAKPAPGPLDFGQPAMLAFLPDGQFLLGDGYQNGRIARFTAEGEFVSQFGSVGSGPGQFDLIHGLAVDRNRRIYVADRRNSRIQVFGEDGTFIEEWPDILDPVNLWIDQNDFVWVLDGSLNRILKYSLEGQLLDYFGAYGAAWSLGRGTWDGGMALPHQMDLDEQGNLYVASWSGRWVDKFVPRADADPARLIGPRVRLAN